jgi:Domain of unknown function (DUF1707)
MLRSAAISGDLVGASALWMGRTVVLPGTSTGDFRAADADRENVIDMLKTAFVQGRLTKDELDARAGRAFAARCQAGAGRGLSRLAGDQLSLGFPAVDAAGALDRAAVVLGLEAPFVRGPARPGRDTRASRRGNRVAEQGGQPGPGSLAVGQLAALLRGGHGEHAADQPSGQAFGHPGPRPFGERGGLLHIEGELDPAVGRVDRLASRSG